MKNGFERISKFSVCPPILSTAPKCDLKQQTRSEYFLENTIGNRHLTVAGIQTSACNGTVIAMKAAPQSDLDGISPDYQGRALSRFRFSNELKFIRLYKEMENQVGTRRSKSAYLLGARPELGAPRS